MAISQKFLLLLLLIAITILLTFKPIAFAICGVLTLTLGFALGIMYHGYF